MASKDERLEERLVEALRDVEFDDDLERFVEWAARFLDHSTIETMCSAFEKVREAGYLERDKGLLIHKRPEDSAR